jgi:hypothetical protein
MKFWPLFFCFLFSGNAFAQWEGDYSLTAEKEGCAEGQLIISQERILFGARLSFDLTPGVVESQEEECFYLTKTEVNTSSQTLRIFRWTERSKCRDKKFAGMSEEVFSFENDTAQYIIQSYDSDGKKEEEIKCQYVKEPDSNKPVRRVE